jgi:hypothetical protein
MNVGSADLFSVGNSYTVGTPSCSDTLSANRCHSVSDNLVARSNASAPTLPGTPPNNGRIIYEASPSGSGTSCSSASPCSITTAIAKAANAGNGAVAHLQSGTYNISSTVVLPANVFFQIIGDGESSMLNWTGSNGGLIMQCTGPCKVTFRDFQLNGNLKSGNGLQITNADQLGGRVFLEQPILFYSGTNSLLVDGLNYTNVEVHDYQINYSSTAPDAVKVVGGAGANLSYTKLFAGLTSSNLNAFRTTQNGHLNVMQNWNDTGTSPTGATLFKTSGTGGSFTAVGMAAYLNGAPGNYFQLTDFSGASALIGVNFNEGYSRTNEVISGSGSGASNLALADIACLASGFFSDTTSPADAYEVLSSKTVSQTCPPGSAGSTQLAEASQNVSSLASFLTTTLAPLRAAAAQPTVPGAAGDPALASGVTDARFYRVRVQQCVVGVDVEH